MYSKKIKVTLPYYIYEIIEKDIEHFNIKKNKLCNLIFENYKEEYDEFIFKNRKLNFTRTLQFNLNKNNLDIYEFIPRDPSKTDADFFRNLFTTYVNRPQYHREKVLFKRTVNILESAILERKKVRIRYYDEYRIIEPYFIANVANESYNYIFAYCHKNNKYVNYKLLLVEKVFFLNEDQEQRDLEYVKKIRGHFSPFLSYGQTIKVRLTETGKMLFERILPYNRPKVISIDEENSIYELEASIYQGQVYFRNFLKDAEILEPPVLREWFKKELEQAISLYKD